jgi:hypothetical protein
MTRARALVLSLLAVVGLTGGVLALSVSPASATYQFPGLGLIDTEYNCPHVANGQSQCVTWIRSNGVPRRGSPAEYWSEASGGYVWTACSMAPWHTTSDPFDLWNKDIWGNPTNPHFHWIPLAGRVAQCNDPRVNWGGPWQNWSWPDIPNGVPL